MMVSSWRSNSRELLVFSELPAGAQFFWSEGAQRLFDVLAAATPGHFATTVTTHCTAHEISSC